MSRAKKIVVGKKESVNKDQIGLTLIGEARTFRYMWPRCRCGMAGTLERREERGEVKWKIFCKCCELSSPELNDREKVVKWWKAVMTLNRE